VKEAAEREDEALLADDRRALFTARIDARFQPSEQSRAELALDPSRFHFFDPRTGMRLAAGLNSRTSGTVPATS
jgi:hypothetical protein